MKDGTMGTRLSHDSGRHFFNSSDLAPSAQLLVLWDYAYCDQLDFRRSIITFVKENQGDDLELNT